MSWCRVQRGESDEVMAPDVTVRGSSGDHDSSIFIIQ